MRVESFLLKKNLFSFKNIDDNFAIVCYVNIESFKNKSSSPINQYIEVLTSFGKKFKKLDLLGNLKSAKHVLLI